jgi:hypothetical protein
VPSNAHQAWAGIRSDALDQMVSAHAALGGAGPGRRYATAQVVHAYAVLLSSHFQGFCRDLHSEVSDHIANGTQPAAAGVVVRELLTAGRKLDTGNPNPGNIGADFGRFGFTWDAVRNHDARNQARQARLEALNRWRNAIAHQDLTKANLDLGGGRLALRMADVSSWRASCDGLAASFDEVVADTAQAVTGVRPW